MTLTEIRDRLRYIQSILRQYWASTDPDEMSDLYSDLDGQLNALYTDVQEAVDRNADKE
jgi:hypothetical protein